jgi:hypothetical protein
MAKKKPKASYLGTVKKGERKGVAGKGGTIARKAIKPADFAKARRVKFTDPSGKLVDAKQASTPKGFLKKGYSISTAQGGGGPRGTRVRATTITGGGASG